MQSRWHWPTRALTSVLLAALVLSQVPASARAARHGAGCGPERAAHAVTVQADGGCAAGQCCPTLCGLSAPPGIAALAAAISIAPRTLAHQIAGADAVVLRVRGSPPTPPPNS